MLWKIFEAPIDSDFGIYFNNHQIQFEQKEFKPTIFCITLKHQMDQSSLRTKSHDASTIQYIKTLIYENIKLTDFLTLCLSRLRFPNGSFVLSELSKFQFLDLFRFSGFLFHVRKWTRQTIYIYMNRLFYTTLLLKNDFVLRF